MLSMIVIILSGCAYKAKESLDFSPSAKEELKQLLQKTSKIDTFDVTYIFRTNLAGQSLADITFRQIKQGNKQRQDAYGNMIGFNLSASSFIDDRKQITCAVFDKEWKCTIGNEICRETSKGKECQSVSQENIPPSIRPELLAKAKVARSSSKQLLDIAMQCYKLITEEGGNEALTEVCLNQDGVILSMAINAQLFQAIIEAISFSTNVQPDVFTLPAQLS